MFKLMLLLAITWCAAYSDIQWKRIPNELILFGISLGLLYSNSLKEVGFKVLAILFLFFFGMLGLMGYGDIKLWMVISCFVGFKNSCYIIVIAAILLIFYAAITSWNETKNIVKITVFNVTQRGIIGCLGNKTKIVNQKAYAFAPFVFTSLTIISFYLIEGGI